MFSRQLSTALAGACVVLFASTALAESTLIRAGRIVSGDGHSFDNASILIIDGRISALGPDVTAPDGARTIDLPEAVVTPGLIDACCVIDNDMPQYAGDPFYAPDTLSRRARERGPDLTIPEVPGQDPWSKLAAHAPGHDLLENHSCGPVCAGMTSRESAAEIFAVAASTRATWAEHSSEVIPHTRVIDSVNLLSPDFDRLLRNGVTTVFVSPDAASVIGARGAIVRTGGDLSKRVVRREDAVKATMGGDPSRRGRSNMLPWSGLVSLNTRRPMTRMGVDFVFRKAFYDARRDGQGLPVSGADTPPAEALPVLRQILAGEIPLRVQARVQHDLFSALRLAQEFDLDLVIEEATEAYRAIPELAESGFPVVYGPIYARPQGFRRVSGEADEPRLDTARRLHESNIPFALTAQEMREEEGLVRQAMMAARHGLPEEAALAAVTSTPAKMLGLPDGTGVLEPGSPADVVVWSGDPLAATSRPVMVLIDGEVVFEQ